MITVHGYGFEPPRPSAPPSTPVLTYVLVAAAAWWAWKKGWFGKLAGGAAA